MGWARRTQPQNRALKPTVASMGRYSSPLLRGLSNRPVRVIKSEIEEEEANEYYPREYRDREGVPLNWFLLQVHLRSFFCCSSLDGPNTAWRTFRNGPQVFWGFRKWPLYSIALQPNLLNVWGVCTGCKLETQCGRTNAFPEYWLNLCWWPQMWEMSRRKVDGWLARSWVPLTSQILPKIFSHTIRK